MPGNKSLQESGKFEIQAYKAPTNVQELSRTHVPFSGSPMRHPHDEDKLVLITDPYSTNCPYYEFNADDISFAEQLPSLVNLDGQTVTMARIWVKKKRVGVLYTPFVVEDTKEKQQA